MTVTLDGGSERPVRTTRIRLTVSLEDVDTVKLRMEDLGFGKCSRHPIRYGRRLSVLADGRSDFNIFQRKEAEAHEQGPFMSGKTGR